MRTVRIVSRARQSRTRRTHRPRVHAQAEGARMRQGAHTRPPERIHLVRATLGERNKRRYAARLGDRLDEAQALDERERAGLRDRAEHGLLHSLDLVVLDVRDVPLHREQEVAERMH